MKKESDAILLRIFIEESAQHEGKHLYKYLMEFFKKEGLAGATVLRGIDGFGKSAHPHTTSILRLSTDLPIVVEVADTQVKIDAIKPKEIHGDVFLISRPDLVCMKGDKITFRNCPNKFNRFIGILIRHSFKVFDKWFRSICHQRIVLDVFRTYI